jgi:hypothetical protein
MGQHAEDILDGSVCEQCGEFFEESTGFPRKCSGCEPEKTKTNYMEEIEQLKSLGYQIKKFTDYHYRINDILDVWPSKRKFHSIPTDERGNYDTLLSLVNAFFDKDDREDTTNLRDHFAGLAMQAMMTSPELLKIVTAWDVTIGDNKDRVAQMAYKYADAMLKARESTQEG